MMETTLGNWPRDQNPESTTAALGQPPLCWSTKYNLRELSSDNNMDLITEALFSCSSGVLVLEEAPGTKTSINSNIIASNYSNILNSNNNIVEREEEVVAAPGPEYYSINGAASNLNLSSQRGQEAARVGGIVLAKYNWEYSSPSQSPPPPLDFVADSLNGGVEASNSSIRRPLISNGALREDDSNNYKVVRFSADHHHQSSSLDNCNLLSASNSGTDKSVEEDDDGISLLFSDCNHLYNWNNLSAASSGESEINNASNYYEITSKDHHLPPADETTLISQTSENGTTSKRSHGGDLLQSSKGSTEREGGFRLINSENVPSRWSKKPRSEKAGQNHKYYCSNNISFRHPNSSGSNSGSGEDQEPDTEAIAQMKEMIYRAAAFRPVNFGLEAVDDQKPKRKNVRISSDPQTVAARQRRERISQRIRVLQRLVPGGSKMDTASMLDEAANYLKFLKSQVTALEKIGGHKQLDYSSSTNNNYATSLTFSPNFIDHTILPMQTFLPHHHKP